jgi:hypothetical protein
MTIDFDIHQFRSETQTSAQAVHALDRERADSTNTLESLTQELETSQSNAGWRERFLGGHLGGNQSTAQRLKEVETNIKNIKTKLNVLEENLKKENESLNKSILDFLQKNSSGFQKLQLAAQHFHNLYSVSVSYNGLLQDAHNKVTDALGLMAWEDLLNHPQAREGLTMFRGSTTRYQRDVETVNTALGIDIQDGKRLEDYIQFTSEKVAIENFNKILSQVRKNIVFAESKYKEVKLAHQDFIKHGRALVLENPA